MRMSKRAALSPCIIPLRRSRMKKRITDKLSRAQKVERAPRMRAAVKSDVSDDGLGKKSTNKLATQLSHKKE